MTCIVDALELAQARLARLQEQMAAGIDPTPAQMTLIAEAANVLSDAIDPALVDDDDDDLADTFDGVGPEYSPIVLGRRGATIF